MKNRLLDAGFAILVGPFILICLMVLVVLAPFAWMNHTEEEGD